MLWPDSIFAPFTGFRSPSPSLTHSVRADAPMPSRITVDIQPQSVDAADGLVCRQAMPGREDELLAACLGDR